MNLLYKILGICFLLTIRSVEIVPCDWHSYASSDDRPLTPDSDEEREAQEALEKLLTTEDISRLRPSKDLSQHMFDLIRRCDLRAVFGLVERCFWYVDPRLLQRLQPRYVTVGTLQPFFVKNSKMADLQLGIKCLFMSLFEDDIGFELARRVVRNGLLYWCEDDLTRRVIQDRALDLCKLMLDEDYFPDFFDEALNLAYNGALQERDTGVEGAWYCLFSFLKTYRGNRHRAVISKLLHLRREYPTSRKVWALLGLCD